MTLQEFKKEFDIHFFAFAKKKIQEYKTIAKDKETRSFFSHLEKYIKGGKRLRPYAAYLGFSESKKKLSQKEWLVFVSLELIHVLALIHDDVIDRATDRRGLDTMNTFIQKSSNILRGDKVHFASSQAIFAAAFQALRESGASEQVQYKIQQLLDEVILGQMIDVKLAHSDFVNRAQIVTKSKYKTALYTFARPLEVGAILGVVSTKKQQDFYTIGESFGLTYQLQDDYLDIFGNKTSLQKELMNDIKEGQQTLVTESFFRKANTKQRKEFLQYFGSNFSKKDAYQVLKLLKDLEVDTEVYSKLAKSFTSTKNKIASSSLSKQSRDRLNKLVDLLEARS
jgi:geranylgeranyl pyrophosphate synthase